MARIRLEKKTSPGLAFVWILIVLVLALIIWWIWAENREIAGSAEECPAMNTGILTPLPGFES